MVANILSRRYEEDEMEANLQTQVLFNENKLKRQHLQPFFFVFNINLFFISGPSVVIHPVNWHFDFDCLFLIKLIDFCPKAAHKNNKE